MPRSIRITGLAAAALAVTGQAGAATNGDDAYFKAGRFCRDSTPQLVAGPAAPDLASRLAALRRPQTPNDLTDLGEIRRTLRGPFEKLKVKRDSVRRVADTNEGRYYLVPVRERERRMCLPPSIRSRAKSRWRSGAYLVHVDEGRGGANGLLTSRDVLRNTLMASSRGRGWTVVGLVPDGVANVTVRFRGKEPRTLSVTDNAWHTRTNLPTRHVLPRSTLWRDARGGIVRSFRWRER